MPKRDDIKSVLLLGAGPIVIGQACEFDYSGTQACRALREEGCRIILVNSNPATIMTDPELADRTYVEPIHWQVVAKIIERERPDALLPTMGGQTALNCALNLAREGVLETYQVELIGANADAIDKAEDRGRFADAMAAIGLEVPHSYLANNWEEAWAAQKTIGFPIIIRPSFTLGGSGGGVAYNKEEFQEVVTRAFELSPNHQCLVEESLIGWKEYEMEVVRDKADNAIIICALENVDPMGVHTGDSITVAPAQTLTDKEYQVMRNASLAILREIGVETGGSNVQFAVYPENGQLRVIEMNPRVSRSSALASKATGFPIAKVAAKLALGYTLPELRNAVTGGIIPASFEPSIDYVVTKIPRFNFEKFPETDKVLTTQMKSVGEVMAVGRTFKESLQKAIRGLEIGANGLALTDQMPPATDRDSLCKQLAIPGPDRLWYIAESFRAGFSLTEVYELTKIELWFLAEIAEIVRQEQRVSRATTLSPSLLWQAKRHGMSDQRLATLRQEAETVIRQQRQAEGIVPAYKRIDSCAAEFPTDTAYCYSSYERACEAAPTKNKKVMILGGGPNRIGQGIEFDYCCVHAALALRAVGYETIMVNCNPETVSTDFDISDRLYFEPLTLEDVLAIIDLEKPEGVIVQYGGQTPLKLAKSLAAAGVRLLGTAPDAIDRAEDRERFKALLTQLQLLQPENRTVSSVNEALVAAKDIGYPLVVRPSYVLGGRAMEVVHNESDLEHYMMHAVKVSHDSPILLDRFLNDAIEVDIDAICDGEDVLIGGILEHIEEAGIHSGDSACSIPPATLPESVQTQLKQQMRALALELGVVGLVNAQFALQGEKIYVLEVNPRASRTIPFVSKAIGLPLAKIAARVMCGEKLAAMQVPLEPKPRFCAVKAPAFPFAKYPHVDTILGPEMKSTGEVMGVGNCFAEAFAKSQLAVSNRPMQIGTAFLSVRDADKDGLLPIAQHLLEQGFTIVATGGTAKVLLAADIACERVNKVLEGRPHIVDRIKNDEIQFIINTTEGKQAMKDSFIIRRSALQHQISYQTTLAGARAAVQSLSFDARKTVRSLQELHEEE